MATVDDEIQEKWIAFWEPIVSPNGQLDIEQVKKELFDYSTFMDQVSTVYCEITNNRISKPNTMAHAVIGVYNDVVDELIRDSVKEALEDAAVAQTAPDPALRERIAAILHEFQYDEGNPAVDAVMAVIAGQES